VANNLQDLFDALDEARMENRFGQLDMAKMTGAFRHVLGACFALVLAVNGTEERVIETAITRFRSSLVHGLGVNDVAHTHGLDLLRRQESELNLLDNPEGRMGMRKVQVRHLDGSDVDR